jgi:hypothetical protein
MVHLLTKLQPTTLRLSLSQYSTAEIHSEKENTLLFCVTPGSGLMNTSQRRSLLILTSDTSLRRSSTQLRMKNPGTELNKNTVCWKSKTNSQSNLLDGLHLDSQDHRDPTIAQLEPTTAMVELSWTPIIELASTLVSEFQEQMLKLCQDSGNSKLGPLVVLKVLITSGLLDT